ncbi:MAG: hypothetical protein LBG19_12945 [Prevotellaceae bacterium]|nr:hypothetical protein [Prevotellaceae bacterium]
MKNGKRTLDVYIASAKPTTDTLFIELSETHIVETIPQSSTIQSDFDVYSVEIMREGRTLKEVQSLPLESGRYSEDKARGFQDLLKQIDKESNRKAVFKQKS